MKKRILLVDDKQEFRTLVKIILQSRYDVSTASNGLEALGLLQNGYFPDLIVSDLMMPVVNGEKFINQLASSDIFKYIPVIVLSSINESKQKVELLKSGASEYLEKPFNPEELKVRIHKLLDAG
ncbi:MAG: response regulator transcription factor [Carboxylicivirga sp.]|jgi:CheY-like chemotaxis protein|nr:response regulator transcription factor [Carboxylicivirga sp.]